MEAGVSPATLYKFLPNKEAIASALASKYAREMAEPERAIDAEGALNFRDAIDELIAVCMSFNRERPEFHTLVLDAPLSATAREEKQALGQVFVEFMAARLRRESPTILRSEASHHGQVALMIFRGILYAFTTAPPKARARLERAMHEAILCYLEPVLSHERSALPNRNHSRKATTTR